MCVRFAQGVPKTQVERLAFYSIRRDWYVISLLASMPSAARLYKKNLANMFSKFTITRKECIETESWLKLLFANQSVDEITFKKYRNLCGRIQRLLTSWRITIENKINSREFLYSVNCFLLFSNIFERQKSISFNKKSVYV